MQTLHPSQPAGPLGARQATQLVAIMLWLLLLSLNTAAAAQTPTPDKTPMQERLKHWAWQPLSTAQPPEAASTFPVHPGLVHPGLVHPGLVHPVDGFLSARLRAVGLRPSPPAPASVQLRRLWFDLAGLPPTIEAIERFGDDPSDSDYAREVAHLLASPRFGERWARHWLDLMRYSETLGHEFDYELPNAWRYRDYVIRALNLDLPYDQFVREHIAGDLLAAPRRDERGNNESVQATASWDTSTVYARVPRSPEVLFFVLTRSNAATVTTLPRSSVTHPGTELVAIQ